MACELRELFSRAERDLGGRSWLYHSTEAQSFRCPLTGDITFDPVPISGVVYDRARLEAYIGQCKSAGIQAVLPLTDQPIPLPLPLHADEQCAAARERLRQFVSSQLNRPHGATVSQDSGLGLLAKAFEILDPLRGLIEDHGLEQPPKVVVVGQQSSGKSSLLERLAGAALFPRGERVCTRMVIRVHLRRSSIGEGRVTMAVHESHSGGRQVDPPLGSEPFTLPIEHGYEAVQRKMQELLVAQQKQGDNSPVVKDREIVIELYSPTVPVIDLIDMPGLTATNSDDAFELLKSYCGRHDSSSLYLFVVEAAAKPEADYALQFLRQRRLKPRSVGVMTKFDELGEKVFDKAVARVLSPSEGDGGVCLQPYGWVATMSDPLEARNDAERLKLQSEAEESFFRDDDRRRALFTEGHATTHALAKRLDIMYTQALKKMWAPKTLHAIEQKKEALLNDLCLLRRGDLRGEALDLAARREVMRRLDDQLPELFEQYVLSVIRELQASLERILKRLQASASCFDGKTSSVVDFVRGLDEASLVAQFEVNEAFDAHAMKAHSFWMDRIRSVFEGETIWDPHSRALLFQPRSAGLDMPSNKRMLWQAGCADDNAVLQSKVDELAVFQLSHYPRFVDSVMANVRRVLEAAAEGLTSSLQRAGLKREQGASLDERWFAIRLEGCSVSVRVDMEGFLSAASLAFVRCTPSTGSLRLVGEVVGAHDEEGAYHARREAKESQVGQLEHAKAHVCEALNLSNRGLREANEELLLAASTGDQDRLLHALSIGADVNARLPDRQTALQCAAACGRPETVRSLLEAGARVEVECERGVTPLIRAACEGWDEVVGLLLAAGADARRTSSTGQSALLAAREKLRLEADQSSRGRYEKVERLLLREESGRPAGVTQQRLTTEAGGLPAHSLPSSPLPSSPLPNPTQSNPPGMGGPEAAESPFAAQLCLQGTPLSTRSPVASPASETGSTTGNSCFPKAPQPCTALPTPSPPCFEAGTAVPISFGNPSTATAAAAVDISSAAGASTYSLLGGLAVREEVKERETDARRVDGWAGGRNGGRAGAMAERRKKVSANGPRWVTGREALDGESGGGEGRDGRTEEVERLAVLAAAACRAGTAETAASLFDQSTVPSYTYTNILAGKGKRRVSGRAARDGGRGGREGGAGKDGKACSAGFQRWHGGTTCKSLYL